MEINNPDIVAEIVALYPLYEAALVNNDVDVLIGMFWASPEVVRFGATENLYGIDEIAAFRKGRTPANLARTIHNLRMVTFGADFASITLEFTRNQATAVTRGRQSQLWARLPEGWRIVSAHVSILPGS